ncbi:unnamed protein product [Trichobilharzia szidati]|nr:unnamed protein product [Trichobilharzia szidati]
MDVDPEEPKEQQAFVNDEEVLNDCAPLEIPPPPPLVQSRDATGPRLIITQIVTENFKSYGGIRVMGPFHKNFSCIIGPNGSGKSNVIDSMLFVFGYRASKVRSKKISQLIHNSELVPNAPSCMVSVHFQKIIDHGPGAMDYEVVPDTQFVVSRRAYKDNSSCYLINNNRAVYRDVANLLRCHGVDIDHNRFLILQGEVEQIALMKPKAPNEHEDGFLEYLEDIIGSSRYKAPLNTYATRIERINDIRLEKLARVKAVEKEKDELESVRNEAIAYLRLVNQLVRLKNILYQQKLSQENNTAKIAKEKLTEVQREAEELTSQIRETTKLISQLESKREELTKQHSDLQTRHRELKAKFADFEAEDSRLRDEHGHTKNASIRLTKSIQTEKTNLEKLEKLPEEANARREEIEKQLAEYEEIKKQHEQAYRETLDNLAKESMPLRMKVEQSESILGPLQSEAEQLTNKLKLQRQQYNLMMTGQQRELERADGARKSKQSVEEKLKLCEHELNEARQRLSGIENGNNNNSNSSRDGGKKGTLGTALASATRDLAEVKAREADAAKKVNDLRNKLADSKSSLQVDNSRSRMLNALLEAKRSGILPGILGRLGDLGAIAPRYDIAVSTACGALNNIVTDTMDSAQQAVNFLKEHNLGKATFIALDKMQKWAEQASIPFPKPQVPFRVDRLYDLIETVEPNVKPAFYFALRNTLVTENLSAATTVAFGQQRRHRVVTLQGQIIEVSGAMSGGGGRPVSGRMMTDIAQVRKYYADNTCKLDNRQKSSTDGGKDVSTLERELANADNELARLRETRGRLEEMIARMTRQRNDAQETVQRWETEYSRTQAHLKVLCDEISQAEERARSMAPSDAERKKIEKEIEKLDKTSQQKSAKVTSQREELERLKSELLNYGADRLAAVKNRMDAVDKKIKQANDELTKIEVNLKTTLRNKQKSMDKLKNMNNELEVLTQKLADIQARLKILEKDAMACFDETQKVQAEIEELQKMKEENLSLLTDTENDLATIQKSEAASRRLVSQYEGELSQATTNALHWQDEIKRLQLHFIDDDDDEDDEDEASVPEGGASTSVPEDISQPTISTDVQMTGGDDNDQEQQQQQQQQAPTIKQEAHKKSLDMKKRTLPKYTDEELKEISVDSNEMKHLEEKIASMTPNMTAIEEYRRKAQNYLQRVSELNRITSILGEQRKYMEEAKSKRLTEFLDGFHTITSKLKEMYQMITQGGDAELELIDSLDPFSEGIVFSVRPPKKSWKNIANLSGGEKTLSSLALVFALHHYKPTPLYVMDEIDAALDFKNVSIVGNYLKERTKNAQFIVISLRNNMFELSDRLVGIYKTYNITKTITLDPKPLMDHLRGLVMRVATSHGRQNDLRAIVRAAASTKSMLPSSQTQQQQVGQQQQGGGGGDGAGLTIVTSPKSTLPTVVNDLQVENVENNHETTIILDDDMFDNDDDVDGGNRDQNGDADADDDGDDVVIKKKLIMNGEMNGNTAKLLASLNTNNNNVIDLDVEMVECIPTSD